MTDILIDTIHISRLPRYNMEKHETEYYYSCSVSTLSGSNLRFELSDISEDITTKIYKVLSPVLKDALESLPDELR